MKAMNAARARIPACFSAADAPAGRPRQCCEGQVRSRRTETAAVAVPTESDTRRSSRREVSASARQVADQLLALAVAEAGHGPRGADPAVCKQAGDARRTVLGQGERRSSNYLGLRALGRRREDVADPHAAGCQVLLQLRAAAADLVRPAPSLEQLHGVGLAGVSAR